MGVYEWVDRFGGKWATNGRTVQSLQHWKDEPRATVSTMDGACAEELLRLSSQVQSLTLEVEGLRELLRGVIAEADRETNAFIEARNALQGSVGETVCEVPE